MPMASYVSVSGRLCQYYCQLAVSHPPNEQWSITIINGVQPATAMSEGLMPHSPNFMTEKIMMNKRLKSDSGSIKPPL